MGAVMASILYSPNVWMSNRSKFWSSTRATEQWWTLSFGILVILSIILRIDFMLRTDGDGYLGYPW